MFIVSYNCNFKLSNWNWGQILEPNWCENQWEIVKLPAVIYIHQWEVVKLSAVIYIHQKYVFVDCVAEKSKYMSSGSEYEGELNKPHLQSCFFSLTQIYHLYCISVPSNHVFVGPLPAGECWSAVLVGWNDWDDPHVWVGAAGGCINRFSTNISTGKIYSKLLPLIYCYSCIDEKQYDNLYIKLFRARS